MLELRKQRFDPLTNHTPNTETSINTQKKEALSRLKHRSPTYGGVVGVGITGVTYIWAQNGETEAFSSHCTSKYFISEEYKC